MIYSWGKLFKKISNSKYNAFKNKRKVHVTDAWIKIKKKTPKFPNNWYEKCPVGILLDKNNSIKSKYLCFSKCDNALLVFKKKKCFVHSPYH